MTSLEIPMNDESTSHTHSKPNSSSSDPATHNTRSSSSSATSSLVAPAQPPSSLATSWTLMDFTNEDNSGAEQVELSKLGSFEVRRKDIPTEQLPLSPPLTRVPTESTSVRILTPPLENDEGHGLEEVDMATHEWHPLARAQSPAELDGLSLHDHDSLHIGSETDKKPRRRESRKPTHLNLEFREPSPQPWDIVDPPPVNHARLEPEYYSPMRSVTFTSQLQNGRRRPLVPHSSYYYGPPPSDSAYGTPPVGQIGIHHPREIVRIERDYGGGELIQFSSIYPVELDGRITPTQFLETTNDINEILISAHSARHSFIYNFLAVATLHLSTFFLTSHYDKEMRRLKQKIEEMNTQTYNPVGLNILWPRNVAFLFLEIEYY